MKLGYAGISTSDQDASMQIEALISVGVDPNRIFTDELSGAREAKERPGMKALMDYAHEEDDVYFWRVDWIGRSVIDVLNTVTEFTSRGIRLHSMMDNLDPTSVQGRMQLAIMATLAEYEGKLINERVRAGVISAQKRGVRFGPAPMEETVARDRVNTVKELMTQGKTVEHAAKTVGWSRATPYRYMKTYDGAQAPREAVRPKRGTSRSRYVEKTALPDRGDQATG